MEGVTDVVSYFGTDETYDNKSLDNGANYIRGAGIKLNGDKCIIKTEYCSSLVTCTTFRESFLTSEAIHIGVL